MTPELFFRYCLEGTLGIGLGLCAIVLVLGLMGVFDK